MVHFMAQKWREKKICAGKLHILGPTITMSWQFLEAYLRKLGFDSTAVDRIMKCVRSTNLRIKVAPLLTP